jgi:hypothetical protein
MQLHQLHQLHQLLCTCRGSIFRKDSIHRVFCCGCWSQVRCVRADLATRVDFQPNSPALIFYPYKQRPALAGWVADERSSTFVVVSHDGSPQVLEGYRLKEPEQIRREKLQREGVQEEQTGMHTRFSGIQATERMAASYLPRLMLPRMTRLRKLDAGCLDVALSLADLVWVSTSILVHFTYESLGWWLPYCVLQALPVPCRCPCLWARPTCCCATYCAHPSWSWRHPNST